MGCKLTDEGSGGKEKSKQRGSSEGEGEAKFGKMLQQVNGEDSSTGALSEMAKGLALEIGKSKTKAWSMMVDTEQLLHVSSD